MPKEDKKRFPTIKKSQKIKKGRLESKKMGALQAVRLGIKVKSGWLRQKRAAGSPKYTEGKGDEKRYGETLRKNEKKPDEHVYERWETKGLT